MVQQTSHSRLASKKRSFFLSPPILAMTYYDITSILEESERTPVLFRRDAEKLGHLCPGAEADDTNVLPEGSLVEVPVWLAMTLREKNFVDFKLPSFYSSRIRARLRADAWVVNLRDRCVSFYDLGLRMANTMQDAELTALLQKTLALRYLNVMDSAFNCVGEDVTHLTRTLTNLERKVFASAMASAKGLSDWRSRHHLILRPSHVIRASRKRRRRN